MGTQELAQIKCTLCGHCCPTYCGDRVRNDEGKIVCAIYPSPGSRDKRGLGCNMTPLELFYYHGIYCNPIVDAIQPLISVKILKNRPSLGRVTIKNFDEVRQACDELFAHIGIQLE